MVSTVLNEPVQSMPVPCAEQPSSVATEEKRSYGQILKSSAMIGGSQVLNIAIGIGRTKALAMLLGPGGFGLASLYNSIAELTQNIAGLGINSSGVRQIAEAVGSQEEKRISLTVAVLRRTSLLLGLVGALVLVVFCRQISIVTFGTAKYWSGVAALAIVAFCKLVSGAQGALIQGMRRVSDLAKMNALGALFGAMVSVGLVYVFREKGIIPYLVAIAAMGLLMSWWYSHKIAIAIPHVTRAQVGQEARALLKLGIAFMISSMMTLGVAYAIRIIVLRKVGLAGTGLYQSAWTLGGMYVTFILQAMGADFYPRLTAHINDHPTSNRLVNEQAHVGLLLATPGIIGTLTFAPLVIATLYSAKFGGSVPILRWICLGTMVQVITWPMGFIIIAKGRQNLFIFCEIAWAVVTLVLTWVCVAHFGLSGTGIAFFLSYVFHGILLYPIVMHLTEFSWSKDNVVSGFICLSAIALVFYSLYVLPSLAATALGILIALCMTIYSLRRLLKVVSMHDLPVPLRRLLVTLRVHNLLSSEI